MFSLQNWTEKLLRVNYHFDQLYFLFLLARLGFFSWNVTKRVTKQKVRPQEFISENFVVSRTQETSIQIFTRATPLVVHKIVNFSSKGTATYMSETSFSTLLSFLPLPSESVWTDNGRTRTSRPNFHGQVSIFYRYGPPLRKARRQKNKQTNKNNTDDNL